MALIQERNTQRLATVNLEVQNANLANLPLRQIPGLTDSGVVISRLMQNGRADVARPETVLSIGDVTPEPPTGTTVTLTSNTSAYVRDGTYANQNFGGATELLAKRSANAGTTRES